VYGAPSAEVDSRRAKIAAEDERRYTTTILRQVDEIVKDPSTDAAPADSLLVKLEQKYPNNLAVKEARQRFELRKKGDLAALEAKRREQELAAKKRAEEETRTKFEGFITAARTSLTAKELAKTELALREAEKLLPLDPKLAPLKVEYNTAKKKADEEAAIEDAARKKADEEEAARLVAKKKADEEEASRIAAKKRAEDETARIAAAAAAKKRAEEDEAARIAAKKRADEIAARKPPPPPPPEKKRKRIGEEDVD